MLIEYLSELLSIPRSCITIDKGATGKRKLVEVAGLTVEAAAVQLGKYLLL
jgi:uncharacterized protein YggU (UPF0235/DUF167 family)